MDVARQVFVQLRGAGERTVLREGPVSVSGRELLALVSEARAFLRNAGIGKGDRAVLLGENSIRWVALDLALAFEGVVVVPLYARQAPAELAKMIRDCKPRLLLCDDPERLAPVEKDLPAGATVVRFAEAAAEGPVEEPHAPDPADLVRIIYTSGTSGDAKGVCWNAANVDFMLPRTVERIDEVLRGVPEPHRAFHYLPCCFAGSWVLLQSCLLRGIELSFCTDLKKLGEELRAANPHVMLNVPLLLERIKSGIEEVIRGRGGFAQWLWRQRWFARWTLYPAVRRQIAPALRVLICGSAPLAEETQRFFMDLGIPVLQVYGLTETTAICTMDRPGQVEPGRVGRAVDGCTMEVDGNGEIRVRGPNVFPGYWGREPREGWLPTGDLGEADAGGNWKIIGRRKFVLVLASGHNVPPEPIEERLRLAVPGCSHVMVVGHGKKYLTALVAGSGVKREAVEAAVEAVNADAPHYRAIRRFHVADRAFTPDDGLLTANGKLKRDAVAARFAKEIAGMYA